MLCCACSGGAGPVQIKTGVCSGSSIRHGVDLQGQSWSAPRAILRHCMELHCSMLPHRPCCVVCVAHLTSLRCAVTLLGCALALILLVSELHQCLYSPPTHEVCTLCHFLPCRLPGVKSMACMLAAVPSCLDTGWHPRCLMLQRLPAPCTDR